MLSAGTLDCPGSVPVPSALLTGVADFSCPGASVSGRGVPATLELGAGVADLVSILTQDMNRQFLLAVPLLTVIPVLFVPPTRAAMHPVLPIPAPLAQHQPALAPPARRSTPHPRQHCQRHIPHTQGKNKADDPYPYRSPVTIFCFCIKTPSCLYSEQFTLGNSIRMDLLMQSG